MNYRGTLIKMENISCVIAGKTILRDINIEVKDIVGRGQVVAILGPSGVGKSTMFRLLSGFTEPTTGKIYLSLKGKEGLTEIHSHEMGVVSQSYPLFNHLTVFENLNLVAKIKSDIIPLVDKFEMGPHLNKYPEQLSGGQRQRIAIIQQLLCSDRYILLDEPFSGLDLISKCQACKLVKDISAVSEENTILVITHSVEDAVRVADTVWMMGRDEGKDGAYIKYNINLIDEGLNTDCCPKKSPRYQVIVDSITEKFYKL